jgi:hypothetical protein
MMKIVQVLFEAEDKMNAGRVWFARFLCYLLVILLIACNLPTNGPEQPTPLLPTMIQPTSALPTVAQFTPVEQPSLYSTATNHPTNTVHSTDSAITIPCNRAEFVNDVTILDGTQVSIGASFTKTWRIKNVGSCTWTSSYVLLFDHGDRMDAPGAQPLTSGNVAPGAVTELSVTLKAPSTPGMYQGDFRLRSPDNVLFGIGPSGQGSFWVKIIVPQSTVTPSSTPVPPDFESIIAFGGGGGGFGYIGYCAEYETSHSVSGPSIFGTSASMVTDHSERMGEICFRGVKPGLPFSVNIESPDGLIRLNARFSVNENVLDWEGFTAEEIAYDVKVNENGLIDGSVSIWWPVGLPFGQWQINSEGEGLQAQGPFDAPKEKSDLEINRVQEVSITDPRSQSNIVPVQSSGRHLVKTNNNGGLGVYGTGYSPNTLIYVLLYKPTDQTDGSSNKAWILAYKTSANADAKGALSIELPNMFLDRQEFLLVSISDPSHLVESNTNLLNISSDSIGYELFLYSTR